MCAGRWLSLEQQFIFQGTNIPLIFGFFFFTFSLTNSIFISAGPERPTLGDSASGLLSGEKRGLWAGGARTEGPVITTQAQEPVSLEVDSFFHTWK